MNATTAPTRSAHGRPVVVEQLRVPGPSGSLSAELTYPDDRLPRFACVLLNPHPHMGGSMANNLIARLASDLAAAGDGATVRFDYSGVGQSDGPPVRVAASLAAFWATGRAPEDPRMVDDARAVVRWTLQAAGGVPLVLLGYSFGAFVAAQVLPDSTPAAVVAVSPTLRNHDLSPLAATPCPKLVVSSDNDFATPRAAVADWVEHIAPPVRWHEVGGGEHFFKGREGEVSEACRSWLAEVLP